MPPEQRICSVCSLPLSGHFYGMGDGTMKDGGKFGHPECFWRTKAEKLEAALAQSDADRQQAERERDALRALVEYARHHQDCPRDWVRGQFDPYPELPCRCGLEAILEAKPEQP